MRLAVLKTHLTKVGFLSVQIWYRWFSFFHISVLEVTRGLHKRMLQIG